MQRKQTQNAGRSESHEISARCRATPASKDHACDYEVSDRQKVYDYASPWMMERRRIAEAWEQVVAFSAAPLVRRVEWKHLRKPTPMRSQPCLALGSRTILT